MPVRRMLFDWLPLLCLCGGCANLDVPRVERALPAPALATDSVHLQIEFVRVPDDWHRLDELWAMADEQRLEDASRRRLAANGLRCGVLGAHLPEVLRSLLATERPALQQIAQGSSLEESQLFDNFRELRSRAGQNYKIVAAPRQRPRLPLLIAEDGHVRVVEFQQAQGLFSLRTDPHPDGRVRLRLTPRVEHGVVRTEIVAGEEGFLYDASRDGREFELLRVEPVLAPGETLLYGSAGDAKGLGNWYFGGFPPDDRSLMLIRVAQTRHNDLFADDVVAEPLVTRE